ncbi:MAG: hypothetical protein BWK73_19615 [Thiothrix lacustris]|uniref:Restriction endonuclease n=1 Tax=Thiothrix lacustris TaxID=525917 RepID=A0A1Y1QPT7_9GAMM|nr:MAG: hypothetical protein BWK73_19615 [Thiothrix lacustris]
MSAMDEIISLLHKQNIKGCQGQVKFTLAGIAFPVLSKDIMGSVLQEWFENWMNQNKISFSKPTNTQEPPDFYLADGGHLEVKAFNFSANPGFDLANFDAYTRSLLLHPERLDADHLVFGYSLEGDSVRIVDFWVKKIWEMAGVSAVNILSLQVKQGVPVNIRPKDWRTRDASFGNRRQFVEALHLALSKFYPERYQNDEWFNQIACGYQKMTGKIL